MFGDDEALPKSDSVADGWTPSDAETKPAPSQSDTKEFSKSLSEMTAKVDGAVQVLTSEDLKGLTEGSKIQIKIAPTKGETTDNESDTWYCYAYGNSEGDYAGDIKDWAPNNAGYVAATINVTSENLSKLKSGGLWIYGNNTNATAQIELSIKKGGGSGESPSPPADSTETTFAVTFDANGGKFDQDQTTKTVSAKKDTLLSELLQSLTEPNLEGKALVGWSAQANGEAAVAAQTKITADTTFFALWISKDDAVAVTFDANGGKFGESESKTINVQKNAEISLSEASDAKKDGHRLLGWATDKNAMAATYTDKYTAASSVTLYAVWEKVVLLDTPQFVHGFDASEVLRYEVDEDWAGAYYDTSGTEKDVFEILKENGVNVVRLRIWVDPENTKTNGIASEVPAGKNTLSRTISMAKRAKSAGLCVMLDFHYSDFWTDPGKQVIPHSWQTITTSDQMAQKISEYTKEVLNQMAAECCLPEYVQVGNEINSGILMHTKFDGSVATSANSSVAGKADSSANSNFAKYLVAGCRAVREVNDKIKIILHVTNRLPTYVTNLTSAMSGNESLYDIIGLSYYPWEDHRTIGELKSNVQAIKNAGKEAMVVETSMPWHDENNSLATELGRAYTNLKDPKTSAVYSDIETGTSTIFATLENQQNAIAHIMAEVKDAGGTGVCAWGGDRMGDWKYSFFDSKGKAMQSIAVFKNGDFAEQVTAGTLTVTLTGFSEAATCEVTFKDKDGKMLGKTVSVSVTDGKATFSDIKKTVVGVTGDDGKTYIVPSFAVKKSGGDAIEITNGNGKWVLFSEEMTHEIAHVDASSLKELCNKELTFSGKKYEKAVEPGSIPQDASEIYVTFTFTSGSWASLSAASSWAENTYKSLVVSDSVGTLTVSDDEAFFSAAKTNGLYLEADKDTKGTLVIKCK